MDLLFLDHFLRGPESFASPGLAYVKWPHPVLRADVLETRTSQSKPTLCILRWRWRLFNQNGVEVLDVEAASLHDPFARRKASALMKAAAPG